MNSADAPADRDRIFISYRRDDARGVSGRSTTGFESLLGRSAYSAMFTASA
ncbi:MAG: hypothetical protein JOZ43_03785 [Acidobacteriales bacterium]|nr:hypothetical protein [Terriglobales bacterium]